MTDDRIPLTERAELFRERWLPEGVNAREFEAALLELLIAVRDEASSDARRIGEG